MSVFKAFAFGVVTVAGLAVAGQAFADGASYQRDVTRNGPAGGSYNRTTTCSSHDHACSSSSSYTGPAGYTSSRSATRSHSGGSVSRSVTGPYGRSVTRSRTWRR